MTTPNPHSKDCAINKAECDCGTWTQKRHYKDCLLNTTPCTCSKYPEGETCGALIHVGFEGNTTCANPKPCKWHDYTFCANPECDSDLKVVSGGHLHPKTGSPQNMGEYAGSSKAEQCTTSSPERKTAPHDHIKECKPGIDKLDCKCPCHNKKFVAPQEDSNEELERKIEEILSEADHAVDILNGKDGAGDWKEDWKELCYTWCPPDWRMEMQERGSFFITSLLQEAISAEREEAEFENNKLQEMTAYSEGYEKCKQAYMKAIEKHGKQNTYEDNERLVYQTTITEILNILSSLHPSEDEKKKA